MNTKQLYTKKTLRLIASCICILCLPALCILIHPANQSSTPLALQASLDSAPEQDADGYYLLRTAADFRWFISTVNDGNTETNIRLCNNLILNDTSDWENWENTPRRTPTTP